MAASATLSGIYTYNLLRSYDNPEHTQASFCQEKVISYEIVRSTFFEQTNSTIRKDTSDRSSSMKVGVAYEILNTELSMKDDMSTEVEDAVKKLTNIATSVKLIDSYRVTDTYTVGPGDTYKLWQRIFNADGIHATGALIGGKDLKQPDDLRLDFVLELGPINFLTDIQVVYGDNEFSEPKNAIAVVDDGVGDINKGHGGKYVWLVPVWDTGITEACSTVDVVIGGSEDGHKDLAKGAKGKFRYLNPRVENNVTQKIKDIRLLRSSDEVSRDAASKKGFEGISDDINGGRGGDYLYLVWTFRDLDHTLYKMSEA